MGRAIIKLNDGERDFYLEYSSIVDAPVTYGMSREEFEAYYRAENGNRGMEDLVRRMERVDKKGTSAFNDDSVDDTLFCNRAGPNETSATKAQIIEWYCHRKPKPGENVSDSELGGHPKTKVDEEAPE